MLMTTLFIADGCLVAWPWQVGGSLAPGAPRRPAAAGDVCGHPRRTRPLPSSPFISPSSPTITLRACRYAVVHGGLDRSLRNESVELLSSLPFDGYAIGGSLGRDRSDMLELLTDLMPLVPKDKPNHLLGSPNPNPGLDPNPNFDPNPNLKPDS